VARKKTQKTNEEEINLPPMEDEEAPETPKGDKDPEQQIKMLIKKGEKKGFLTYEEINDSLPEDVISPARLDKLLATLDEK
jgi:hypothetical protein